ncbi:unnamed protein product [Clavelina lepadiformis]|uniref:RRM domain-containing protein n=1 Tax=Clavelina lepadiformis TaxID=159417 RepID=A0ABP0G0W2_CLALP
MNTTGEDTTVFVGNLNENVSEAILYELFLQAGPVKNVSIPKDRTSGRQRNYGFVTFKHEVSVPYSIKLMNGIKLFDTALRLNIKQCNKNSVDSQSDIPKNGSRNTNHQRLHTDNYVNGNQFPNPRMEMSSAPYHPFYPRHQAILNAGYAQNCSFSRNDWEQPASRRYGHHISGQRSVERKSKPMSLDSSRRTKKHLHATHVQRQPY